jgi:hypothetical protein
LDETQFWWKESNELTGTDVQLESQNITAGLCGASFRLAFSTSTVFGVLKSQPGRGCGKFRRYCVLIQRPRKAGTRDRWTVSLETPECGANDRG